MPVLENDVLRVELDPQMPRPVEVLHKPTGGRTAGADPARPLVISLNRGVCCYTHDELVTDWHVAGQSARFVLRSRSESKGEPELRVEGTYNVDGSDLLFTFGDCRCCRLEVKTVDFEGMDFVRLFHDGIYIRDIHQPARWDRGRGKGLFERRWESGTVIGAVPDGCALPAIVAGGYNARVGVSVYGEQRYLPFVTRCVEDRHPFRTAWFSIAPNTIYRRVRDKLLPPYVARIGFFGDLNGDGRVDRNEIELWHRRQHSDPDPLFRERLWYKIFLADAGEPQIRFAEVFDILRRIRLAADNMPQIAYLVGWQYDGHDTGYPALDRVNPALGTREDLVALIERARKELDTIVSVHINLDDAYPGNPGFDPALLCTDIDGQPMVWETFAPGAAYHLNHTRDVEQGHVFRRLDAMRALLPLTRTIHIDAFRCSNLSWGNDGFIGPMEELECGVKPILEYLRRHGLEPSIEALDRQGVDLVGLISAVWHLTDHFLLFGKVLGGATGAHTMSWAIGGMIDHDIRRETSWADICNHIYLGARLYQIYLTDEPVLFDWVDSRCVHIRFARGGEVHCRDDGNIPRLRVQWDGIEIARDQQRFLPVQDDLIYVYGVHDEDQQWTLPLSWTDAAVTAETITPTGIVSGPELHRAGRTIRIPVMPHRPVRLLRRA